MKKPNDFDAKLAYGIDLLQRAQKYALIYNPDGFYLAFSGGKDSQAIYHLAKLAGVRFHAHMSPTTVDPPEVIKFVRNNYPDVNIVAPKISIYDMALKKKMLPTKLVRWCCEVYKEGGGAGEAVIIGIRHAESTKRAKRSEVELRGRAFAGTLDTFEIFRQKRIEKAAKKAAAGTGYEKMAPKTSTTVGCLIGKESLLISPIIYWTEADVWYFLNEVVKVPHCQLYDEGWHRIGCILCPMASTKQWRKEEARWPHVKRLWLKTIEKLRNMGYFEDFEDADQVFDWWKSKTNKDDYLKKVHADKLQTKLNF